MTSRASENFDAQNRLRAASKLYSRGKLEPQRTKEHRGEQKAGANDAIEQINANQLRKWRHLKVALKQLSRGTGNG
jgi:hypothetical protein